MGSIDHLEGFILLLGFRRLELSEVNVAIHTIHIEMKRHVDSRYCLEETLDVVRRTQAAHMFIER